MGVYLIPLDLKYEAILCLCLLESSVLIEPVEELAVDMVEVGGRLVHLGLGKPRAFLLLVTLVVANLRDQINSSCKPTTKNAYHWLNRNQFSLVHLHCWISGDNCGTYS